MSGHASVSQETVQGILAEVVCAFARQHVFVSWVLLLCGSDCLVVREMYVNVCTSILV